jgi:hypothetical protein
MPETMLALEGQGPTYIILDALDECPPREEVLELVKDLVGLHLPNLHISVTSRPEPDIQIVLEHLTERPMSLHDESGQKEDIANYVSSSVHSDRRMGRWWEEDKELVIKTIGKGVSVLPSVFMRILNMEQVPLGVLSIGAPTAVLPSKCPAYS